MNGCGSIRCNPAFAAGQPANGDPRKARDATRRQTRARFDECALIDLRGAILLTDVAAPPPQPIANVCRGLKRRSALCKAGEGGAC